MFTPSELRVSREIVHAELAKAHRQVFNAAILRYNAGTGDMSRIRSGIDYLSYSK
jgi:hypothetical protein